MDQKKSLSYQLNEIMKYQMVNNTLPQQLIPLCYTDSI